MEKEPEKETENEGPDFTSPGEVTNLKATTPADGTVTLTWTDPKDKDFAIVYAEFSFNHPTLGLQRLGWTTPKGYQTRTAENLRGGVEYTVKVTTQDIVGNRSEGVTVKVTPR